MQFRSCCSFSSFVFRIDFIVFCILLSSWIIVRALLFPYLIYSYSLVYFLRSPFLC